MEQQTSAAPARPVVLHEHEGDCDGMEVRGAEWREKVGDEWVLESKYLGGLDDEEDIGDEEFLFGGSDGEEEEEDFFQGVRVDERDDDECIDPSRGVPEEFSCDGQPPGMEDGECDGVPRGPAAGARPARVARHPRRYAVRCRRRMLP